jgi:hypothetical protein
MLEAVSYCKKKEAEIDSKIAIKQAHSVAIEGESEKAASQILGQKREQELNMRKLAVLYALAQNPNATISGNNSNSMAAQLATYKAMSGNLQI